MKITENLHIIRNEFNVTPTVRRYVNIYIIVGKNGCYLIDAGVSGAETLIGEYLESIGKSMSDIKGVFLTHSHPDHIGAAACIKRQSGCKIYAPFLEKEWIENIQTQYKERPIPNFYNLVPESVTIDYELIGDEILHMEDELTIRPIQTPGHSHGSMSYILNDEIIFTGDAIPAPNDLPIFTDYSKSIHTLNRLSSLPNINLYCPAWDKAYTKEEADVVITESTKMLTTLKDVSVAVYHDSSPATKDEKISEILKRTGLSQYAGNPLVAKSIEACI